MKSFLVGALALLAFLVVPTAAGAVTINVTTTEDEFGEEPNSCSLREAIVAAQNDASLGGCPAGSGSDTVVLPGGTYKITRAGAGEDSGSTGDFDISGPNNLLIRPSGPTDRVIIDGNGLDRVFDKTGLGETTIESVRIRGGKLTDIEDGGGLRISGGGVFMENVTIDDNETAYQGGGIAVYSVVHLTNSTVSGNRAGGSGGGIYAPGGSLVQARSTTIVENTADSDGDGNGVGGGFAEAGSISIGFTNVLNAGNRAAPPAGPERFNDCSSGPFYFPRNTIQTQAFGPADCLIAFDPGTNLVATAPMYKPLAYNGGQTPTHDLLRGSLAIGKGGTAAPDTCPPIDQNGVGRISGSCDVGSTTYVPMPKLGIVRILPKKKVIRRGKAKRFRVAVRNTGDAKAERVRVCLALPKAARRGLRARGRLCRNLGEIAPGATKRANIRLGAKPRARKRAYRVRANVRASGDLRLGKGFRVRVR